MSIAFPAAALEQIRALNEANLPHSAQVETYTSVPDGEGGATQTWAASGDPLPCRVSAIGTPVERVQGEQVQDFARYLLVVAAGTMIPLDARVRVTIGMETLLLDPHGSNGPISYEALRKYECSLWRGA